MKKLVTVLFALLLIASSAYAAVDAYVIPTISGIYDDIDALYLIAGKSIPSASKPWSVAETELAMARINRESLDDAGKSLYDNIAAQLEDYKPRWNVDADAGLSLKVSINPEIYTHKNTEDFVTDTDWAYSFDDRLPAANLEMEFSVKDYFYSYSEFTFAISRFQQMDMEIYSHEHDFPAGIGAIVPAYKAGIGDTSYTAQIAKSSHLYRNAFSTNIPALVDVYDISFNFPMRAIVSVGKDNWNLLFGRERLNWGTSNIGNFVIDDHVGYHEVLRASFFTDGFKYEWTNLFLETMPRLLEDYPQGVTEQFKIFMNHRLEYRPFDWMSFALSESIMYIGQAFEVQNLNPAFIYHQLNNRAMFNSLGSAEVYVTPVKGLNLFFEFGLDNATLPNEGTSQANASGYLVGAEYSHTLADGYVTTSIEYAQTSPIMYRRDEVDFLMVQRSYSLGAPIGCSVSKINYIGFPYGPDAKVFHIGATYKMPGVFEVAFDYKNITKGAVTLFASHNDAGNNSDKANLTGKTPTGANPIKGYEATLSGMYNVPEFVDFMDMKVKASLSFVGKRNFNNYVETVDATDDVQFSMGVSFLF